MGGSPKVDIICEGDVLSNVINIYGSYTFVNEKTCITSGMWTLVSDFQVGTPDSSDPQNHPEKYSQIHLKMYLGQNLVQPPS